MIKKCTYLFGGLFLFAAGITSLQAQQLPTQIALTPVVTINFSERALNDQMHPPKLARHHVVGQGEDREEKAVFPVKYISSSAVNLTAPAEGRIKSYAPSAPSAAPTVSFNGVLDNGTLIPPDIEGAAGPTYIMETTNQQFNIYNKNGTLAKTVSITTLFSSTGGSGYFDPHVLYDSNNARFIICIDGIVSNGDGGIFIAVSQTSDPTGNWYVTSFDGIGNTKDFLDFPEIGYNTNWIVVTANDFYSNNTTGAKIYVLNRAALYSGTATSTSTFTDNNSFCITPAQTIDNSQTTEFLVEDWNGNSNGNGYMNIGTITGTASAPVYSFGNNIGINKPWSETAVNVPQKGGHPLEVGDTRVGGNATYINGSLWFAHSVFLPAAKPTHAAVDWWQINPVYPFAIQQFNRIEDASASTFYFYPAINVNSNGDALLGFCQSSSTTFASAAYTFHAAGDAASTMQGINVYKSGLANYYKTYGGGRNRWGDFTGTAVDPSNNSFWNFNQWANTSNMWGTVIANVAASSLTCNAPTSLTTTNVTSATATFNWSAASGAVSYNIQYRIVGTPTWSTGTSTTTSFNATGLTVSSNYEWQVQTVCAIGPSPFTSSATFSTPAPPCGLPDSLTTGNIADNSATFNWDAVSSALSYNVQYRIVGTSAWTPGSSSTNSYNATGLTAGSNYEWQVQTVCSATSSSSFTGSTFTTTGTAPCNAPSSGFSTTSIATTTATFNWGAVSGAVSYNVQYRVVGTSTWSSGSSAATSYNATGLTPASNYEWQVQTVCAATPSSFTASNNFQTATPPCSVPASLSAGSITGASAIVTWGAVSGAVSYSLQWKATSAPTWNPVTGITANSYSLTSLASCTGYEFEVLTVCQYGSSAYSSSSSFTTTGCSVTYCTSKGTTSTYEYINKVVLGTINNTSGDNKGYADFTAQSTNLAGGTKYTISLTPGFHSSTYKEYWNVWIDYNHNGVFTDAGEKVATGNSTSAVSLSFTVPITALNGATRMRIQMQYGTYASSSCLTYTYGEVEDYTVNITGNAHAPLYTAGVLSNTVEPDLESRMVLYPNPAQDNLTVELSSKQKENIDMNIYDILGKKVITQLLAVGEGPNTLNINTAALKSGIYIFEIENNGETQRQKFMISK